MVTAAGSLTTALPPCGATLSLKERTPAAVGVTARLPLPSAPSDGVTSWPEAVKLESPGSGSQASVTVIPAMKLSMVQLRLIAVFGATGPVASDIRCGTGAAAACTVTLSGSVSAAVPGEGGKRSVELKGAGL